jgi:hypothetical protein
MTKTAEDDDCNLREMKESRKRPHRQLDSDDKETEDKDVPSMTPSARRRQRRKRAKTSQAQASTNPEKPLAGMVLCISTLKDNVKSKKSSDSADKNEKDKESASISYNDVCQSCRDLGADVIDLVCKRVTLLVCTEAAVRQATQRVRKALKRNKPLVSLDWLEQCKKRGRAVDFEEYRLDKKAKDALQNRNDRLSASAEDDSGLEFVPDAGWSEPKELGCCCVCHENGTTADCPWCVDCKV